MDNQTPKTVETVEKPQESTAQNSRPDDTGRISVDAQIKIFDPASRKVYVEQQA